MQLRKLEIIKYRNFENLVIDFKKNKFPNIFSIA
jgi:recombinational DNA repair ATPase RecF